MAYSVYSYGSQYLDAGQIGIYVGTREENLRECLEVIGAELRDVGAGNLRNGELERAKENMKGRLLLSLESTSARMSRLGKAVVLGTEILPIEEIERHDRRRHGRRCGGTRPRPLRAGAPLGGRDRPEREALPGSRAAAQSRGRRACGMRSPRLRPRGEGGRGAHAVARGGRSRRPRCRGRRAGRPRRHRCGGRLHDADRGSRQRARDARGRRSLRDRHDRARRRRSRAARSERHETRDPVLRRGELRARCRADDAIRRRGGAVVPAGGDHRVARRYEARRAVGHGEGDSGREWAETCRSTPSGFQGSSPTRR